MGLTAGEEVRLRLLNQRPGGGENPDGDRATAGRGRGNPIGIQIIQGHVPVRKQHHLEDCIHSIHAPLSLRDPPRENRGVGAQLGEDPGVRGGLGGVHIDDMVRPKSSNHVPAYLDRLGVRRPCAMGMELGYYPDVQRDTSPWS